MIEIEFTEKEKNTLYFNRYNHANPQVRRKIDVVWLKSNGLSNKEITKLVRVTENTVRNYLHQYLEGGISRLCEVRYHRPQSELDKHEDLLTDCFVENPPATANEARAIIIEQTGIKRSTTQVRQFMKRLGMRPRKTKILPAKAQPEKQESFKRQ